MSKVLCSKVCYVKRRLGVVFSPPLPSLFLGKFGITRSRSGCGLEEGNKAVAVTSKLVEAKYHPEAEEYPADISEGSQRKEGDVEAPVTEC